MKSSYIIFLFFICGVYFSCNSRNKATGKIFERKETQDNKLMIKYSFIVDGKSVIDSTIIDNKVLSSDSIIVNYDPSNPSENTPALPH